MTHENGRHVYCADCGRDLEESRGTRPEDREPCPTCGSVARHIVLHLTEGVAIAGGSTAKVTVNASGEGHAVPVGTASERETALPITAHVGHRTDAVIGERFRVWYEYTEDGSILLHTEVGGTGLLPFYVGPGDDLDSAAMAVAEEFLESIKPPPGRP